MIKRKITDRFVTKLKFSNNLVKNVKSSCQESIKNINVKYKQTILIQQEVRGNQDYLQL